MTVADIGRALKVIGIELKEIVASYFSPVLAVVKGVRWSVDQVSRHRHATDHALSEKPRARH